MNSYSEWYEVNGAWVCVTSYDEQEEASEEALPPSVEPSKCPSIPF